MAKDDFIASLTDGSITLTKEDVQEITVRLVQILHSLRSIHFLAGDAMQQNSDEGEYKLIAIEEMARANIKGIDAISERLGCMPQGNFATEFDNC